MLKYFFLNKVVLYVAVATAFIFVAGLPLRAFAITNFEVFPCPSDATRGCVDVNEHIPSDTNVTTGLVYKGDYGDTSDLKQSFGSGNSWSGTAGYPTAPLLFGVALVTIGNYWVYIVDATYGEFFAAAYWDGTTWTDIAPPPVVDTRTRFISLLPLASSTVATTTSIGAEIYINDSDYEDGMYLTMSFTNQTVSMVGGSALDAWNSAFDTGGVRIPLVSGLNNVSTTTTFGFPGKTDATYKVMSDDFWSNLPLVGDLFNGDTLMASSTHFYVGFKTPTDLLVETQVNALNEYFLTGTTTGSNLIRSCGAIFSDGLVPCLTSLVVPNSTLLATEFQNLRNGFLSAWPLGYVSRFIEISLQTSTSTLPSINYTAGDDSMFGPGFEIHLDPFGAVLASSSPLYYVSDQDDPKTIWEIMSEITTIIVYMSLLFMIIHDLTGVLKHGHKNL